MSSTATLPAPAKSPSPLPPETWESTFRAALARCREALEGTATRVHRHRIIPGDFGTFWLACIHLARAYCRRPMPGKFASLGDCVNELLREAVIPSLEIVIERNLQLGTCEFGSRTAASLIDTIANRLESICNPPRNFETVARVARLPNMSAIQLGKMFPHLTIEQLGEWNADPTYKLPEPPRDRPAPELPEVRIVDRDLAELLLRAETLLLDARDQPAAESEDVGDVQDELQSVLRRLTSEAVPAR